MMSERKQPLGQLIKRLRLSVDMSQSELAKAIGVDRSYVGHVESGRINLPSRDVLTAMARALGATPKDLLIAAGYMAPEPSEAEMDAIVDRELHTLMEQAQSLPEQDRQTIKDILRPIVARNLAARQERERRER